MTLVEHTKKVAYIILDFIINISNYFLLQIQGTLKPYTHCKSLKK